MIGYRRVDCRSRGHNRRSRERVTPCWPHHTSLLRHFRVAIEAVRLITQRGDTKVYCSESVVLCDLVTGACNDDGHEVVTEACIHNGHKAETTCPASLPPNLL